MSPSLLLAHIGSISFASCFIPVIGARAASSSTDTEMESSRREERSPVAPIAQPLQRPNPPNLQLFRLAAQLRRQIAASPLDAAFTLRQLHLLNQEPQIFLPELPSSTSMPSPLIFPETWVWRLPAAAALHAILRILAHPSPSSAAEVLLPIAIRITRHALRFDAMMWSAVLRSRDPDAAATWDECVEWDRAVVDPAGPSKASSMPRIALAKRPRARTPAPNAEAWQLDGSLAHQHASGAATAPAPKPLRPPASLPARSLDRLFLHLARDHTQARTALSISLAMSRLRRRRSPEALSRSIDIALRTQHLDVAAQFCADWLRQLEDFSRSPVMLVRLLRRLSRQLRDGQGNFAVVPSLSVLRAIAHLSRALDDLWTRLSAAKEQRPLMGQSSRSQDRSRSGVVGALIHLLVKVPDTPSPLLFKRGSPRRRHARVHSAAARMASEVLRRVLEDVVEREITLNRATPSSLDPAPAEVQMGPTLDQSQACLPLGVFDLNALLAYALHRLEAPEVALAVLERMGRLGIKPSAATENILFGAFDGEEERAVARALSRAKQGSERATPTLLTQVAPTASHDEIERLVFRLLPELDLTVHPDAAGGGGGASGGGVGTRGDATKLLMSAHAMAARPPPSTGRSPYLYTTLLHALACAGRTGLAERVFRNARWAAIRSRSSRADVSLTNGAESNIDTESPPPKRKGWVLPPHAFTSMLRLYAAEVRRGTALEQRRPNTPYEAISSDEAPPHQDDRAFVRGWGRRALRVFLARESRAQLAAQLGPSASAAGSSSSFSGSPSWSDMDHSAVSPPGGHGDAASFTAATRAVPRGGTTPSPSPPPSPHAQRLRRTVDPFGDLPPILRSEAAPLVAIYELEGGSRDEAEQASLRAAMRAPQSRDALRVLFPQPGHRHCGVGEDGDPERTLSELGQRAWRRGERVTWRRRPNWGRAPILSRSKGPTEPA